MPGRNPGSDRRRRSLQVEVPETSEALTEQNRALLAFFASEIARYVEAGVSNRLDSIELKLEQMESRMAKEDAMAVREIMRLFSRHRLFRVLRALSGFASDERGFTKNSLIRAAGVGQGFRTEGLDRLVDVLCSLGLLVEVGRRGRGTVYAATSSGRRFLQSYLPKRSAGEEAWGVSWEG